MFFFNVLRSQILLNSIRFNYLEKAKVKIVGSWVIMGSSAVFMGSWVIQDRPNLYDLPLMGYNHKNENMEIHAANKQTILST